MKNVRMLVVALAISACSKDEVPLPGERLSILQLSSALNAETATATQINHGYASASDGSARPACESTATASMPRTAAWTRAATRSGGGKRPGAAPPIA